MIVVELFRLGSLLTNSYVVYCEHTKKGIIIDPACYSEDMNKYINDNGIKIEAIIATHSHVDHINGAEEMICKYRVPFYMHSNAEKMRPFYKESCKIFGFDSNEMPNHYRKLDLIKKICFGNCELELITTPGHSPCGITFYNKDVMFTGDFLFKEGIGRYDLPFSSLPLLYNSLKKIKKMPVDKKIYPGHGPTSSLDHEFKNNAYLNSF